MVSKVETVRGSINNLATQTDLTFAGFGTVAGCKVKISLPTTDNSESTSLDISIGFWDGTTAYCQVMYAEDSSTLSNTWFVKSSAKIGYILDNAGAFVRSFTISGITNGVRITASSISAVAYKVDVLLYGGSGTLCKAVAYTGAPATGGGTRAITGVGFMPDFIEFMGDGSFGSPASATANHQVQLGYATRLPTVLNCCAQWRELDNEATAQVKLYVADSVCQVDSNDTPLNTNRVLTFDSDGFTIINDLANGTAPNGVALCVKMPNYLFWCGSFDVPTSTGNFAISSPGFKMLAAQIVATGVSTLNSTATDSKADSMSLGFLAGSGTPVRNVSVGRIEDAANLIMGAGTLESNVPLYVTQTSGTLFKGDWVSWDEGSGVTLNLSTAPPTTARKSLMLAIGEATRYEQSSEYSRLDVEPPAAVPY